MLNSRVVLCLGSALLCTAIAPAQTTAPASTMVSPSKASAEPVSIEPVKPTPKASPEAAISVDPASLLPDLPRLPQRNATLIGGTISRLDRVRDRFTVRVFGGGHATILFDPRTKVFRGTNEVTLTDLHEGDRVYLDTILDGDTVFARTIRLRAGEASGETQGIVLKYREDSGELTIRDGISPQPVRVRLGSATKFMQGQQNVSASALQAGALIAVTFDSQGNGNDIAREISILAAPGAHFTFTGQVVHIDLRLGLLALNSSTDHKTYEVYLDQSVTPDNNLHPGANVTVLATFDDSRYIAHSLTIDSQNQ